MEDFRRTYLRLCKESGLEPQESVLNQLHDVRAAGDGARLDLATQSLSVDTCAVLGRVLSNDVLFVEVVLSDCMLSEEGVKLLLYGLCSNTTVKVLDLKGNNMRAVGSEALGKLLRQNKSIRRLTLEWNALGMWGEAFSIFCEGLGSNEALKQLDLRNNQINHQGAGELAMALKRNTTLQELDLRWNNIGLLGGRALLESLQQNRMLLQLEMAGNNVPSDTLKAVEQSIDHNSDRKSTLKESRSKTQVLSKEIRSLREEKGKQFLNMMETIDKQREDLGRSSRMSAVRGGQLQEALNERKSAVNSLKAKLQMTEAALALSEQNSHDLGELLSRVKLEKSELKERQSREMNKEQKEAVIREGKLIRELQISTEKNLHLKSKVDELEWRCKAQQDHVFDLKQELTNSTAELKLRLAQAEERLEAEKKRSKQTLDDAENLRQKEQQRVSHLEEKLRLLTQSRDESQIHCTQQKWTVSELQAKNNHLALEMEGLKHRLEELQQELGGKEQEKVAEVNKVRVELQEQIGHLQAERATQGGLKEKIAALEREVKVQTSNHREALLDKESETASLLEKLRLKDGEIMRMREDEAQRANFLQKAILTYVQGSPLGSYSPKK
ncbi:leucine-rich repeat-containing protein 45-like [Acipenser ruthenus]|uniref:leucine-rich repeat-containing protein 45-like n=1 Tax=Acipenser ruthenus TaxID=7906 RepID=UPI002740F832|nr:leucine-rich repeat-containing protein 45-like [Acipenser ruthenus]XP_058848410.1 leucine-rich repeat-containing protein 45-like [Acipenser ruthenus]XP_058848411.1 leucine-rich repeat-containing protein 45-like [Acipenser ruthenus]